MCVCALTEDSSSGELLFEGGLHLGDLLAELVLGLLGLLVQLVEGLLFRGSLCNGERRKRRIRNESSTDFPSNNFLRNLVRTKLF